MLLPLHPSDTVLYTALFLTVPYFPSQFFRLQESIMDFYWHYASKETIDPAGQETLTRALNVASQVFNTITEVIQVRHFKKLSHGFSFILTICLKCPLLAKNLCEM